MNNENDTDVQEENEEKENIIIHCLRKILCISEKECLDQFDSTKNQYGIRPVLDNENGFQIPKEGRELKKIMDKFLPPSEYGLTIEKIIHKKGKEKIFMKKL